MNKFKPHDKVIIVAPPPDDNAYLDGAVGTYLRKANNEKSVVRIEDYEFGIYKIITIENKYIKLYDVKYGIYENNTAENFIPELQEILGIKDDVKFYLNNDLSCKCYFENGKLFLSEKNSDKVIKDDNLRNKVFYGLATGTIKPIVGRLTTVPKDGFKYYYWDTSFGECQEMENSHNRDIIQWDYWKGSIKDYMCFYVGNCFPSKESCEKNYNIIEQIKNRALRTGI